MGGGVKGEGVGSSGSSRLVLQPNSSFQRNDEALVRQTKLPGKLPTGVRSERGRVSCVVSWGGDAENAKGSLPTELCKNLGKA